MARMRSATDQVRNLASAAVERALAESRAAGSMKAFYATVDMRNPSRSYFVRHGGRLHSLKAVAASALRQDRASIQARDFHAADAAARLTALGFDIVHVAPESDERERLWISRLARPGQSDFRAKLIDLYGRCALSGCMTPSALEAAHVDPVASRGLDDISNGILLRADIHKLFDANLIAVHPDDGKINVSPECKADYGALLKNIVFSAPPGGPSIRAFAGRWRAYIKTAAAEV